MGELRPMNQWFQDFPLEKKEFGHALRATPKRKRFVDIYCLSNGQWDVRVMLGVGVRSPKFFADEIHHALAHIRQIRERKKSAPTPGRPRKPQSKGPRRHPKGPKQRSPPRIQANNGSLRPNTSAGRVSRVSSGGNS